MGRTAKQISTNTHKQMLLEPNAWTPQARPAQPPAQPNALELVFALMPHVNLSKLDPKIQKQLYRLVPTAVPVPAKQEECPLKYAAVAGCPYDAVAEATKS